MKRPPTAPSPVASNSSTAASPDEDQVIEQIGSEISRQLDKSNKDLERLKLVLLVDGIRDARHKESVAEHAEKLIDAKSGSSSVVTKGGYGNSYFISVSPVSDFDTAVAGIKFGAIMAVDPEKRTIVVDAASQPALRPESGWPGRVAVRQFIGRKTAAWAFREADENLIQKLGSEKTVVVCYPGSTTEDAWSDSVDAKLQKLSPGRNVSTTYTSNSQGDVRIATLGPMASVQDVAAALDGHVLWVDEEHRVIVLERPTDGEVDGLRPEAP